MREESTKNIFFSSRGECKRKMAIEREKELRTHMKLFVVIFLSNFSDFW